jgi:hypothetical protein
MSSTNRRLVILAACLVAAVAAVWVVAGLWPSQRSEDEALHGSGGERDAGLAAASAAQPAAIASQPVPALEVPPAPGQPTSLPAVDESGYLDAAGASTVSIDPSGAMPTSTREESADASVPVAPEISPTRLPVEEIPMRLPADALDQSPTSLPRDGSHDAGAGSSPIDAGSSPTQVPDASPGSGG